MNNEKLSLKSGVRFRKMGDKYYVFEPDSQKVLKIPTTFYDFLISLDKKLDVLSLAQLNNISNEKVFDMFSAAKKLGLITGTFFKSRNQSIISSNLTVRLAEIDITIVIKFISKILNILFLKNIFYFIISLLVIINGIFLWREYPIISNFNSIFELNYELFINWIIVVSLHEVGHAIPNYFYTNTKQKLGLAIKFFIPSFFINTNNLYLLSDFGPKSIIILGGVYFSTLILTFVNFYHCIYHQSLSLNLIRLSLLNLCSVFWSLLPFLKNDGYALLVQFFDSEQIERLSVSAIKDPRQIFKAYGFIKTILLWLYFCFLILFVSLINYYALKKSILFGSMTLLITFTITLMHFKEIKKLNSNNKFSSNQRTNNS